MGKKFLFIFIILALVVMSSCKPSQTSTSTIPSTQEVKESASGGGDLPPCEEILNFNEIVQACGMNVEPASPAILRGSEGFGDACRVEAKSPPEDKFYQSYVILHLEPTTYYKDLDRNKPDFKELQIGHEAYEFTNVRNILDAEVRTPVIIFKPKQKAGAWELSTVAYDSKYNPGKQSCTSFEALETIARNVVDRWN